MRAEWMGSDGGAVPEVDFRMESPMVMVGANERRAAGLPFWVDGTMGFHRSNGRCLVVAPNGPTLARHDLSAGGFVAGLLEPSSRIRGLPLEVDHASGGPLHHDAESGLLLLVYHGETFRNGDDQDYYAFLGMAVSDDGGSTFHDLGRVITSELEEHDPLRPRPVDLGPGAFVVRDGWFYLYFQDRGILDTRRELSVAAAPVIEVVTAARDRRAPVFRKLFEGSYTEPGLGGRSDELIGGTPRSINWFDASFVEPLGCSMIVYSTVDDMVGGRARWNHEAILSRDGIHWSVPKPLSVEPQAAEMLYVTVDSGGPCQRTVTEDWFHLYWVRSTAEFRWDDACLQRVTVRYELRGGAADGSSDPRVGTDDGRR